MEINELREQIDSIDDQLVMLFIQRMELSAQIADYKKRHNLPIHVPAREEEVLQKIGAKAGPDMANYCRMLYATIFELSRSYQCKRNIETISPEVM